MTFDYFYCDYVEGAEVESGDPVSVEVEQILRAMKSILTHKDNFLGIVDEDGTCMQFIVNENGTVDIDFPVTDDGGSFSKSTTLDECLAIVAKLDGVIARDGIVGLEWNPWTPVEPPASPKPWWKFW